MARHPNRASESSRLRIVFCLVLFIAATIAVVGAIGSSRATGQHVEDNVFHLKIAPWVVEHTANGQKAKFFVVLADQADLSGAAALSTKAEKGRYVYDALRKKRQETQRPILRWLRDRAIELHAWLLLLPYAHPATAEILAVQNAGAEILLAGGIVTDLELVGLVALSDPPRPEAMSEPLDRQCRRDAHENLTGGRRHPRELARRERI